MKPGARAAGTPDVQVGVVGTGTAGIFDKVMQGDRTLNVAFTPSKGIQAQSVYMSAKES